MECYDIDSYNELLYEFSEFQDFSGLSINYDKTEVLRLGSLRNTDAKFYSTLPLKWSDGPVRILGMQISGSYDDTVQMNYTDILEKVQNLVNVWSTRMLTPIGKICVVNTLINSQVIYKLQSLPTPSKVFFDTFKRIVCNFVWDGKKAKISYRRLISSYKNGGLQLRDLVLTDMSLKVAKIHKMLTKDNTPFWVQYFLQCFKLPLSSIFQLNFSEKHVKRYMSPSIFRDMCYYWAQFKFSKPTSVNEILQQMLWYNSHILIQNKWYFNSQMNAAGASKVIDLFDLDTGKFMSYNEFNYMYPNVIDFVSYYALVQAIPAQWKNCLRINAASGQEDNVSWAQKFLSTKIKPSRFVYNYVRDYTPVSNDTVLMKWNNELNTNINNDNFCKLFIRLRSVTKSTKLRYFQYRLFC